MHVEGKPGGVLPYTGFGVLTEAKLFDVVLSPEVVGNTAGATELGCA